MNAGGDKGNDLNSHSTASSGGGLGETLLPPSRGTLTGPASQGFLLSSGAVIRTLWAVIALVIAGNVVAQLTDHYVYTGRSIVMGLLDVNAESSFPTWLSSMLFLVSGLLILVVGRFSVDRRKRMRWSWGLVASILVALSVDEVASLHETSNRAVRRTLDLDGILYYAWLVPAAILLGVAFLLLLPWLARLPSRLRRWILLAGIVFLSGTLGFELAGSYLDSIGLQASSQYVVVSSIEESLELVGVGLLFSGLIIHLSRERQSTRLDFSRA